VGFVKDFARGIVNLSPHAWTALAAWLAVMVAIAAALYVRRQVEEAKEHSAVLTQPNVAMFMEPSAKDWHLIELVVKNYGRTPAFGIRFEFGNAPTVPQYENAYEDHYVNVVPLNLPAEIPYLAPLQEWRMVWDSALDRGQLGDSIESRFDGAITYYDKPNGAKTKAKRRQFRTSAVLDWGALHPVERLELLTSHDLARQEKQKLELLRGVLTYYQYATKENREEVLREEIKRIKDAVEDTRERYRNQFTPPQTPPPAVEPDDAAFQNAETMMINGRHRQDLI
jgi:hypothetical protein